MSENILSEMSVWELLGNLSLSVVIGSEAFAAIGAIVWALLYSTGLVELAVYGGLGIGVAAAVVSAVWVFRMALKQRHIQAQKRKEFPTVTTE